MARFGGYSDISDTPRWTAFYPFWTACDQMLGINDKHGFPKSEHRQFQEVPCASVFQCGLIPNIFLLIFKKAYISMAVLKFGPVFHRIFWGV